MPSQEQQDEWQETCTDFGMFIETRYGDQEKIPAGDEKTFYSVYCLCGLIDADGMRSLLAQAEAKRAEMFTNAKKLGLKKLVAIAEEAEVALKKSGLSAKDDNQHSLVSALVEPFEERYHGKLRPDAYKTLYKFLNSKAFKPYALNCVRIGNERENPFDPSEWQPPKFKG